MSLWIVVPAVNCLTYTQRLLASVPADLLSRLIVIDNASTDGTPAYLATLEQIRVLRQSRNLGVAASWNLGIFTALEAGATCVAVLNNDLILAPDTLQALERWLDRGLDLPTVKAVQRFNIDRTPRLRAPGDLCGFVISARLIDAIGWFDETYWPAYGEDVDYLMRMRTKGLQSASCGDALAIHQPSRTIREGGVVLGNSYRKNEEYFKSTWSRNFAQAWCRLRATPVKV